MKPHNIPDYAEDIDLFEGIVPDTQRYERRGKEDFVDDLPNTLKPVAERFGRIPGIPNGKAPTPPCRI